VVLISDGTSIRASNAAAQLGPEDTKGARGKSEDAEGQFTGNRKLTIYPEVNQAKAQVRK
jgi:hypothetical protein